MLIQVSENRLINPDHVAWFEIDAFDTALGMSPRAHIAFVASDKPQEFWGQIALNLFQCLHPSGDKSSTPPALPEDDEGGYTIKLYSEELLLHCDGNGWGVTVMSQPGCFVAGETLAEALADAEKAIIVHKEGEP